MQPVNDDMDHLFRQAANSYPLNTQGADFDKLQQRMQAADDELPPKKERRRSFLWLLLLLIPLPFIFEHHYKSIETGNQQSAAQQAGNKSKIYTQNASGKSVKAATTTNDSATGNLAVISKESDSSLVAQRTTQVPTQTTQKEVVAKQQAVTAWNAKKTPARNTVNAKRILVINKKAITDRNQLVAVKRKTSKQDNKSNKLINLPKDSQTQDETTMLQNGKKASFKNGSSTSATSDINTGEKDSTNENSIISSTQITSKQKDSVTATIAKAAAAKDSATQDTTAQKKQLKEVGKLKNYLYAGIVAGADYSVVKSTRTSNTGYSAGIVAGYRFGRHWGVETGLLWNHKSYYSDGQYVSTEKLMLTMHTEVLHINGYCDLFELPLTVQYHFSDNSKGHWYTTIGLSSYLMKQEEYYYLYRRYNMNYYGKNDYPNSTKNWFSILQLGGGYQLKLSRQSSLRAEPYIKLPVSKIGIAQLPLSSTGLTIGYSRSF